MAILREVSLIPDNDFAQSLERAFERGLGHKLSPGRPYDQLVATFAADNDPEMQKSQIIVPWDCSDGLFATHDELRWQNGPGPTYSSQRAEELLQGRYKNLVSSLRFTIVKLASSEEFRLIVLQLRAKGWLDWHILTAVFNIVMNYRFSLNLSDPLSEKNQREMLASGRQPESATAESVPAGRFTFDQMNDKRQLAMLSSLRHWGLELHQSIPDYTSIELFLKERYGYWDDDVPHSNPFPDLEIG